MTTVSTATRCLVITGGSKGIGLATAKRFQSAGYRVVNISRTAIPLADAVHIDADLSQQGWLDKIAASFTEAIAGSEAISLIHNSAVQIPAGIAELKEQDLRTMLDVNVIAPAMLNTRLIEHMKPGSSILYVGSTLSVRATRNQTGYVTSKHGMIGLMRSTCQDLAGTGIHTACVCPGFTETEMLASFAGEMLAQLGEVTTQGRLIAPEEIAETLYFSAQNPVINGSVINADLGWKEF